MKGEGFLALFMEPSGMFTPILAFLGLQSDQCLLLTLSHFDKSEFYESVQGICIVTIQTQSNPRPLTSNRILSMQPLSFQGNLTSFETVARRKDPMRKIAEAIGLAAIIFQLWITRDALYGPNPLPATIPTHFGLDGQPNGWGSSSMLFLLPVISLGTYLLMTVVGLFPVKMNLPVKITEENRPRLQAIARTMVAWIKVEMVSLFAWIQWSIIQAARSPERGFAALPVPAAVGVILATVLCFIVAMQRAAPARPNAQFKGPGFGGSE